MLETFLNLAVRGFRATVRSPTGRHLAKVQRMLAYERYEDSKFTADWTTMHFGQWEKILEPFRARKVTVLELGSYEGRSAIFFLETMPHARVTCVDAFFSRDIEKRFDRNLRAYRRRLEKIKALSLAGLAQLTLSKRSFDVIYIDGSHRRDDVLSDTVASWPLLRKDGVLIWDDYGWQPGLPDAERPCRAIDFFLDSFSGCYTLLYKDYQVIVQKIAEWPA